jgi:hypothetical protein
LVRGREDVRIDLMASDRAGRTCCGSVVGQVETRAMPTAEVARGYAIRPRRDSRCCQILTLRNKAGAERTVRDMNIGASPSTTSSLVA